MGPEQGQFDLSPRKRTGFEKTKSEGSTKRRQSTVFFFLLVLPSWIDDSSRKPCLLDLAKRAMICSPGVLHARPSNSASRLESLFPSLFLFAPRFTHSHLQNRSHRFFRFDQSHVVEFFTVRCASYPLCLPAGYNLRSSIHLSILVFS